MKILIFSVGGAGRAIYRTLKDKYEIVGFIENNSKLHHTYFGDTLIYKAESVKDLEFDKIVIGGIWFNDMKKQLLSLGVEEEKIWILDEKELIYGDSFRENKIQLYLKEFTDITRKANISYIMDGSSLLWLLRKEDLAKAQDIDIMIRSKKDLETLYLLLKDSEIFKDAEIIRIETQKDTLILKKGELKKIVIKSKDDPAITEPIVIDLHCLVGIKDSYFIEYGDFYMYYRKKDIDGEKFFDYKGISLLIPYNEDKFLELLYGKNWIVPVKNWHYLDYGNLLNEEEFKAFIK